MTQEKKKTEENVGRSMGSILVGLMLVGVGVILLLSEPLWATPFGLVAVGLGLLFLVL